jgi:Holliday junction DNA helicase RuvB
MSRVISEITKIPLFVLNPESIKSSEDLLLFTKKLSSKKSPQNLVFIDEIHELSLKAQEVLGIAMEEGKIFVDNGYLSKEIKLPNFTILGATTVPGVLSKPFLDRFGATLLFDFYSLNECGQIANNYLLKKVPGLTIDGDALHSIAKRGRGTPRIVEKLCDRIIDYITVNSISKVSLNIINEVMNIAEIDSEGLTKSDVAILKQLFIAGRPIGVDNLSACSGEDIKTISTKIEPFLIRQGLLVRTPQGRMLTPIGVDYLLNNNYITSSL